MTDSLWSECCDAPYVGEVVDRCSICAQCGDHAVFKTDVEYAIEEGEIDRMTALVVYGVVVDDAGNIKAYPEDR